MDNEEKRAVFRDEEFIARLVSNTVTATVSAIHHQITGPDGPIKDHETRLREVEKWKSVTTGVHLCVNVLAVIVVSVSTWVVTTGMAQVLERLERIPGTATGKR